MDASILYEILRDSSVEIEGKKISINSLPNNFTERDILSRIDNYFQELVKEYRRRKGKYRDRSVERICSRLLLSMMGYECEGVENIKSIEEVDDALRALIRMEGIRTIITESNNGILKQIYEKNKRLEREMLRLGE